jgi:hypothetical protein
MSTRFTPSSSSRALVRPRYFTASGALKMLRRVGANPIVMVSMAFSLSCYLFIVICNTGKNYTGFSKT